ncbi:hypothetical protein RV02_GL001131 [Enterococcus gilvus]|nr:hypothetical protein RV02_GL001131 [Enterococcus gilvus]
MSLSLCLISNLFTPFSNRLSIKSYSIIFLQKDKNDMKMRKKKIRH